MISELNAFDFLTTQEHDDVTSGAGTIDVTAKLQQALDTLSDGGELYLPPGVYLLDQATQAGQLTIKNSNVRLRGAGRATILKHVSTGTVTTNQGVIQIFPVNGDIGDIEVRDLCVSGPAPAAGQAITSDGRVCGMMIHDGASPHNVMDILIKDVLIEKTEGPCFAQTAPDYVNRCERVRYENCVARNTRWSGYNDFAGSSDDVEYINCTAHDCDGFGFEVASARLLIDGCHIWNVGQAAIGVEYGQPAQYTNKFRLIRRCNIHDIGTSAYPDAPGIALGQSYHPFNTEIADNLIYRCGGAGITLGGASNQILIHGNTIINIGGGPSTDVTKKIGIWFGAAGVDWEVYGNRVHIKNAGFQLKYGIAAAGAGHGSNVIHSNVARGATVAAYAFTPPTLVTANY